MTRLPSSRFLEVRSAYGPTHSHDGQSMFFLSTISGMPQVWRTQIGVPWPQQVTFFADRVMHVEASPTEARICVSADEGGSERAQLYLMDFGGVEMENLTNDSQHIYHFGGFRPDGRQIAYASNRRNGRDFDIYVYDLSTRTHRVMHESAYTNYAVGFSPDGSKIVVSRYYTNLNNDLFLLDVVSGEMTLLTQHEGEALYEYPRFTAGGKGMVVVSNRGSEFSRVGYLDLVTQDLQWLTPDEWDCETLELSHDGRMVTYSRNEDGTSKLYVAEWDGRQLNFIPNLPDLPAGVVLGLAWGRSSITFNAAGMPGESGSAASTLAMTLSAATHGVDIWTLDVAQNELVRSTFAAISSVPESVYVEPRLIHYPSFDGLQIPAYYYTPTQSEGPYSVVVYVHGGPESQSRNTYSSVIQYFVHHGYAVLVPNVRGSSGYGVRYVHLDDVQKRMDSVADLARAVDWLIQEGNAIRDGIAVMGGSYGGFMVLAAVTHYPELWAAGVDIVGIANLRTFIENTSAYRRHLRESEYGTIEADGEFFDAISPIHHVDKIQAPMMIIHGANDPRVPVSEAEQMVAALQARNHPVTYLRFEDEGHGVVKLPNRIKAYGAIAEFLGHVLPQ